MNKQTVSDFDFSKVEIDRGKLLKQEEITEEDIIYFKRYGLDSLVSERTIPGQKGGIHNANSYEHSVVGLPSEVKKNTVKQKNKRSEKIETAFIENPFILNFPRFVLKLRRFDSATQSLCEPRLIRSLLGHVKLYLFLTDFEQARSRFDAQIQKR